MIYFNTSCHHQIEDQLKPKEESKSVDINNRQSPEKDPLIVNKIIWVFVIVFILTICLFLILKFSIDLANSSKVELIKMKDSYSRLITEQLLKQNNPNIVID